MLNVRFKLFFLAAIPINSISLPKFRVFLYAANSTFSLFHLVPCCVRGFNVCRLELFSLDLIFFSEFCVHTLDLRLTPLLFLLLLLVVVSTVLTSLLVSRRVHLNSVNFTNRIMQAQRPASQRTARSRTYY